MEGTAGGLKEPLAQDLNEDTKAKDAANRSIDDAALHGLSHIRLHLEIGTGTENAEKQEHHGSDQHQQDAVAGGAVSGLLIPFAQAFAEQRVDTDTDTHGKADLQVLHRERQGKGRDGALRDPGHIDAVHHIIECLDQHGYHHRQRHIHQQFADGHDAHLILFQSILFHWTSAHPAHDFIFFLTSHTRYDDHSHRKYHTTGQKASDLAKKHRRG